MACRHPAGSNFAVTEWFLVEGDCIVLPHVQFLCVGLIWNGGPYAAQLGQQGLDAASCAMHLLVPRYVCYG